MLSTITMAAVTSPGSPDPVVNPVVAICFGLHSQPLPEQDQEREFRIQAEGLLLHAEMLRWERTGEFDSHAAAARHQSQMFDLIKGRSARACAWIAEQKGLAHA